MALIKKLALGSIFISILCIFAMSHNAGAISPTFNIDNYSLVRNLSIVPNDCSFTGGINQSVPGLGACSITVSGVTQLNRIETDGSYELKSGDIINFYLFVYSVTTSFEYQPYIYNINNSGDNGFDVIDFKEISNDTYNRDISSHNGHINEQGNNYDINLDFYNFTGFYKIYEVTLRNISGDRSGKLGLYSRYGLFVLNSSDVGQIIRFSIRNIKQFRYSGSQENKEQEEKTQEAVDDSQDAGSDSSSAASAGGANLLTAITGFFNVITSAQPTNCRFNAPLNTYFGNENLNVDLCALDLPAGIGALTSIIAIGILIPFAIHMFNKFIALFRSFQG